MVTPATQTLINSLLTPGQLRQDVSTAVAAKTLKTAQQQGAQIVDLIEAAGQSGPGDPLVAKATGLGNLLDITA